MYNLPNIVVANDQVLAMLDQGFRRLVIITNQYYSRLPLYSMNLKSIFCVVVGHGILDRAILFTLRDKQLRQLV